MKTDHFEVQVQSAQDRLQAMQKLVNESSSVSKELQNEAIAELSISLEELHVATEELQAQNEELLASRQALEMEHQRYQELFDFAPDGYLVTDSEGVIQQVNGAATNLLNLRQDLVVGKPLIVFIDQFDQTSFHTQLDRLIHQGHALIDWEVSLKPRDKTPFPVSISVSTSYYSPQGHLCSLRWLMRDLSQRKQNEQKIREQADLLNVATDAIMVLNLADQILFWNKGAEQLYGWSAAEVQGKTMAELLYRDTLSQAQTIQKFLAITKGEWQGELEQVTQSNQSIIVESRWTIMRDEQGNLKSIFIVNTDITAKKQLELQLLHHQQLESLGRLAGGIAHDLNNILTPMLVISKLLPLYFSTADDTVIRLLEILDTNVSRASELIQQIKLFSGVSKEKKTNLQIGLLISDIVKMAESVFPKSIALHTEIDPELRCVKGNSIQLHQVLLNLCINARDAMPDGGTLSLFAKNMAIDYTNTQMYPKAQCGPYIVITISDTGVGISAETVGRIFDPFFTTKPEGQGIGLSIVAGVVKDHHGFITVSSRVERGTQFQIFLPALDTTDISLEESLNIPLGNTELILLVDDEAMILETTKILLEQSGYRVLTAQNGSQAISLYQQHKDEIRTIILDMMMPSMDGQTAILGLKAINENVKIIVNSGLGSSYQFDAEYDTNIQACLTKPYRLETLLMTVREAIDNQSEPV